MPNDTSFDIVTYLQSRNINLWTHGKNVTAGWVGIQCPFPYCSDHSNHLGIPPDGKAFKCYICGSSGHIVRLIKQIDSCHWNEAYKTYKSFIAPPKETILLPKVDHTALPKGATPNIPESAKKYLRKRRFDPDYLIGKYHLKFGGVIGSYKFRLILPFYLEHRLVTFSSLDFTEIQSIKYKHQSLDKAILDPSRMLYNIDSVKDKMILVEGPTDVWRIGDGCCSVQGKNITIDQICMIMEKDVQEVIVMFDSDATKEGEKLAIELSLIVSSVEYILYKDLWEGDPDSLPDSAMEELRKNFFKNNLT